MNKSILKDKSYAFPILIVKLSQLLDTDYVPEETHLKHCNLNKELVALLVSSIKTTKSKI